MRCTQLMVTVSAVSALAIAPVPASAATASHGRPQYPYTLFDIGTLGGPSSFFDGPGVPLSTDGALIGAADTATLDSDYPNCAPPGGCSDPYVQHAFTFQDGRLTDLGALPGQNISAIYELNIYGVGAGSSEDGLVDPNTGKAAQVAVLFDHGQVTDLGTLAGGDESFAQDIDDQGQVAGFSSNGTPDPYSFFGWGTETRTFVWRNGVMTDLGTLGGNDTVLQAQNQRGQIAGWSYTNDTPSPYTGVPTTDPFLWEDGHMIDLGTLGGDYGVVNWLNDSGEVVGWSQLAGDPGGHAFAWDGGRMVDLGTLGGALSSANWVSDNGDIAGTAQLPNGAWNGVLWRAGKTIDLPPVDGAPWSSANAVNDGGEVVGNVTDTSSDELDGVLWTGGVAYDLNTLVAPSPLHLASGEYINDQGDIVGMGMLSNGDQRIFEMVPNYSVPLPGVPTPRPLPSTGLPCEASWSWAHHPW